MSIRASTVIMKPRSLSTLHVGLMPSIVPRRRITFRRHHSTKPGFDDIGSKSASSAVTPSMARLPTKLILRSLVLTSLMSSKLFLRPSLAALDIITISKSAILNPDRNRILNRILRWTVYDQFCAGTNHQEVSKTVADIKKIGYQGVILGYAKEIMVDPIDSVVRYGSGSKVYSDRCYDIVEEWKKGTLKTLRMVGPGDYLAVKLTGAGPICIDAMAERKPMPAVVARAMDEICLATREQGSRLWLDAEQQVLQHGLDDWAIEIMKKHNKSGPPLVYNTIQAYLKGSKSNLDRHLTLASEGGFGVGVKLVRGAYIEHEMRSLIHDTKEETDRSYDLIADAMICRRMPEGSKLDFPNAALFLATHNAASVAKAIIGHQKRVLANKPVIPLECGQIQGMADELSCKLVQNYERALQQSTEANVPVPKAFKCMVWGSVAECMQYLHRRSIENKGAVERTQHMVTALKEELRRRIFG